MICRKDAAASLFLNHHLVTLYGFVKIVEEVSERELADEYKRPLRLYKFLDRDVLWLV